METSPHHTQNQEIKHRNPTSVGKVPGWGEQTTSAYLKFLTYQVVYESLFDCMWAVRFNRDPTIILKDLDK